MTKINIIIFSQIIRWIFSRYDIFLKKASFSEKMAKIYFWVAWLFMREIVHIIDRINELMIFFSQIGWTYFHWAIISKKESFLGWKLFLGEWSIVNIFSLGYF